MTKFFNILIYSLLFILFSCGGSDKLNIRGDPEAVLMAESMIKELGGKKAWFRIKSVYIRTISSVATTNKSYISEEWIDLDKPKFMNIKTMDNTQLIDIIDGNDGWHIENKQIQMLSPNRITSYLDWYEQHFMRVVKFMAEEKENIEVRKKSDRQFDYYINGEFQSGFELYENNLPSRYYTKGKYGNLNSVFFKDFREYKGYKFPVNIAGETLMAVYTTDYFDPSHLEVEKAFKITFNPNILLENLD